MKFFTFQSECFHLLYEDDKIWVGESIYGVRLFSQEERVGISSKVIFDSTVNYFFLALGELYLKGITPLIPERFEVSKAKLLGKVESLILSDFHSWYLYRMKDDLFLVSEEVIGDGRGSVLAVRK